MTKRPRAKIKRQATKPPTEPISITVVSDESSGRKMMALKVGKTFALISGSVQIGSMTCSIGGGR